MRVCVVPIWDVGLPLQATPASAAMRYTRKSDFIFATPLRQSSPGGRMRLNGAPAVFRVASAQANALSVPPALHEPLAAAASADTAAAGTTSTPAAGDPARASL